VEEGVNWFLSLTELFVIIPYVKFGVTVLRYVTEMLGISMRLATGLCKYFCSFMAWFYV
jgi:hypothetical protein